MSVITPVYNASKFVPRLLMSLEGQEDMVYEHILVDDCSQDNSYELLCNAALKNPRMRVIRLSKNSGPVVARNEAVKYASGQYLAFLDADDYWMPSKLSIQVKFMRENNAAISFSDYRFISEDGSLIGERISGFNKIGLTLHHMTRYLGCLTVMVDRDKVDNFIFPNIAPNCMAEDFLAWSNVIERFGPALRCPYDLARYAQVVNSRSSAGLRAARSVWEVYRDVEKIPPVKAFMCFVVYLFFSTYKRLRFKPRLKSSLVDGDIFQEYLLGDCE